MFYEEVTSQPLPIENPSTLRTKEFFVLIQRNIKKFTQLMIKMAPEEI